MAGPDIELLRKFWRKGHGRELWSAIVDVMVPVPHYVYRFDTQEERALQDA